MPDWRSLRLALVAACAAFSGCAVLPKFESPQLSVISIKMQSADIFSQRLSVRMRVLNPNSRELPVKGISYRIEVNDADLAAARPSALRVPAMGEAEFDVQVPPPRGCPGQISARRGAQTRSATGSWATWRYPAAFCGASRSMSAAASSSANREQFQYSLAWVSQ